MLTAEIHITLKDGVLDPQGATLQRSLETMGYVGLAGVRMGKYLRVTFDGTDRAAAAARVESMCREILANPVIEQYRFDIREE